MAKRERVDVEQRDHVPRQPHAGGDETVRAVDQVGPLDEVAARTAAAR
jgi:hypothetical protein